MTNTTNYNLKKPEDNDNVLIGDLNENADAIDQALHGLEEGKAAKAKPAKAGSLAALDESGNLTDSGRTPGAAGGVATLDEGGKVPEAQLPEMNYDPAGSAAAVQKALDSHTGNKQNPHGVTAKQAGADPAGTAASAVAAHNQNGEAHPALQAKLNGVSMTAKATYPVAEGQTITAGDVVDIVGGQVQGNKKPLSQYTEGSLITLNENGSSVGFYVAKINYTSGGTLVVRKGSAGKVVWNTSPNTLYPSSNIISWLNSTYLNQLDPSVASSIMNISWSYISSASTVGNTTVKVGLLSPYEYGITSLPIGAAVLGTVLPAGSTISSSLTSIKWTRQAYPNQYNGVLYVSGSSCSSGSADNSYDIQPAFCLPNSFIATSYDTVPSQAIALQGGTAGQNIEVIYSGTVAADWVTEGQVISSAGVYGAGVLDGVLQVWSKDRPGDGLKYTVVEYTGTKQLETGSKAAKTIEVGFYPIAFFISIDNSGTYHYFGHTAYAVRQGRGSSSGQSGNGLLHVDWTDTGFTFYALLNSTGDSGADASAINSMNSIGRKYHCLVLGVQK